MKRPTALHWQHWLPTRGNVLFTLLIAFGLLFYTNTVGAVPARAPAVASTNTIPYQGRLADASGVPINGPVAITFRLYDDAVAGNELWVEDWPAVQVNGGLFNVLLGSTTPITPSIFSDNDSLWLGVRVGNDSEMTPRVQLGSAPFAIQSLIVPDGSITDLKIANNDTEPTRAQTWSADTEYSYDATGAGSTNFIDPGITITVPTGKAYYYLVIFNAYFKYNYSERTGSNTGFFGAWNAAVAANTTLISSLPYVVYTGYRQDWSTFGNSSYWVCPVNASWVIRLSEGTHDLNIQFNGYSDSTMNIGRIGWPRLQVMRIP